MLGLRSLGLRLLGLRLLGLRLLGLRLLGLRLHHVVRVGLHAQLGVAPNGRYPMVCRPGRCHRHQDQLAYVHVVHVVDVG